MGNLRLVLLGVTALLLAATQGLTQFDRRGGGRSRGDPNEFFNRLSNGKDVIIRSELDPPMQGMFDRMAERLKITNGQMTREQFMNYQEIRRAERYGGSPLPPPGSPTPAGPSGGTADQANRTESQSPADIWAARAEESFRRYDLNGDGYLNYDEMPPELREDRDRWDTDHNGLIDLYEFKAYFQARMQQRASERAQAGYDYSASPGGRGGSNPSTTQSREQERKPVIYRHDTIPKELAWFKALDTDHDGQVGLYEWRAGGGSVEDFLAMDRNNDGFLTVDEVLRYQAAEKQRLVKGSGSRSGSSTVVADTGPGGTDVVAGANLGGNSRGRGSGRNRPGR